MARTDLFIETAPTHHLAIDCVQIVVIAGCRLQWCGRIYTVSTGKRSDHPRGMSLVTRMSKAGIQWHPRVRYPVSKRAPYPAHELLRVTTNPLPIRQASHGSTFSVWTEFTVWTGKKVDTREECH
jgi:hypothetical protein